MSDVMEWMGFILDNQFAAAGVFLATMGVFWLVSKRDSLGVRPRMKQVEAGMQEGWATPKEVKQAGLYE